MLDFPHWSVLSMTEDNNVYYTVEPIEEDRYRATVLIGD